MTTMATEETAERPVEDLIAAMLSGDSLQRILAYGEAVRRGYGGVQVVDQACNPDRVITLDLLHSHLQRVDSATVVRFRGHPLHRVGDITLHDPEDGGRGPAFRRPA